MNSSLDYFPPRPWVGPSETLADTGSPTDELREALARFRRDLGQVPQDYLNVARVLNLSEWKIFTSILFPAVLPYMLTGVRLSIGVAWLVIVAAEMLTGGVGIGFWVWDEWNNLNVMHILIAILVIGLVGLALEWALISIARLFCYDDH
jgi:nitrate/nitrite transport system permease protein